MSHYDEQRERYYNDMAEHLRGQKADAECAATKARIDTITQSAEALVKEANQQRISRALAGLVSAAERIAAAIETLAAARPELAISGDHGDAPITFSPQTLEGLYGEAQSHPTSAPRALIEAIKGVSWFGCTHRHDVIGDELVMSVTRDSYQFEQLARLLDMQPSELEMHLQTFAGFTKHPGHYSIRFPADWARAA